ncbi:hypothetical protein P8452_28210 [Trifolium repens]|nr:hypothetical protein P8452_28210 [Trifolium repens]
MDTGNNIQNWNSYVKVGWLSHLHLLTLGNCTFIMMLMTCIKNQKEELKAKQRCNSLSPLNLHFVESTIPRYITLDAIAKDLQSSLSIVYCIDCIRCHYQGFAKFIDHQEISMNEVMPKCFMFYLYKSANEQHLEHLSQLTQNEDSLRR